MQEASLFTFIFVHDPVERLIDGMLEKADDLWSGSGESTPACFGFGYPRCLYELLSLIPR